MSSETTGQFLIVKTEEAAEGRHKCPVSDSHIHKEDVKKIWKECQEESFWYRALPLSLGGMAVTGGLIYNGVWNSSKRLGPFPKLAVAGILGYAVGKASYVGTCRSKFKELGFKDGPGFGPGYGPGSGPGFGPKSWKGHPAQEQRGCHHVCKECKKEAEPAAAEKV
ncbi:OCIA domain-containing protein 2 [Cololabis saira]|uniref:OCIA domain-containing protein 2 n=1 Tax=Cololabis saira TaxID=129043 RepID=UPI002AD44FAB|nr:OCIA domain-containing protein 2 [Cololabis saira]